MDSLRYFVYQHWKDLGWIGRDLEEFGSFWQEPWTNLRCYETMVGLPIEFAHCYCANVMLLLLFCEVFAIFCVGSFWNSWFVSPTVPRTLDSRNPTKSLSLKSKNTKKSHFWNPCIRGDFEKNNKNQQKSVLFIIQIEQSRFKHSGSLSLLKKTFFGVFFESTPKHSPFKTQFCVFFGENIQP